MTTTRTTTDNVVINLQEEVRKLNDNLKKLKEQPEEPISGRPVELTPTEKEIFVKKQVLDYLSEVKTDSVIIIARDAEDVSYGVIGTNDIVNVLGSLDYVSKDYAANFRFLNTTEDGTEIPD